MITGQLIRELQFVFGELLGHENAIRCRNMFIKKLAFTNRRVAALFMGVSCLCSGLCGCNSSSSGYPEVKVITAIGSTQRCHQCGKSIDKVSETHVLNAGSAQYIVCDEACRKKQVSWHMSQFGK